MRANVIFEYGILHGLKKPVILLKESGGLVDIHSYFADSAGLSINNIPLNIDSQFSDVKDINYAVWNRFEFSKTVELLRSEYRKKKAEISDYIELSD